MYPVCENSARKVAERYHSWAKIKINAIIREISLGYVKRFASFYQDSEQTNTFILIFIAVIINLMVLLLVNKIDIYYETLKISFRVIHNADTFIWANKNKQNIKVTMFVQCYSLSSKWHTGPLTPFCSRGCIFFTAYLWCLHHTCFIRYELCLGYSVS